MMNKPSSGATPPDAMAEYPTHSEGGADLTLIRWMLSLTPAERLEVLQGHVDSVLELRDSEHQE